MLGFKADGIVDKEAAKQLGITTQAFTTATSRIYSKIGATNGAHAVAIALRNRWIP